MGVPKLLFLFLLLIGLVIVDARRKKVIKCNSNDDCDEKNGFFCIEMQCLQLKKISKCRDNDDCNEVYVRGHSDGTEKKVWLKCIKDPHDEYGHCHPANTRFIQLIDADVHRFPMNSTIMDNSTMTSFNATDPYIQSMNSTGNSTLDLQLLEKYSTLKMKQLLIQHFQNVSTLHYPICKLVNGTSTDIPNFDDFLHFYHESLFHARDRVKSKECGTIEEEPITNADSRERFAAAEGTIDEEKYPIPPCGYGICDNPDYRKKYFSFDAIVTTFRKRIIFLQFHVFPSVQFADARIAASVRRMNDLYGRGNIMFMAFVSNYRGRYANAKLVREQDLRECVKNLGRNNCVLDSQIVEEIYGAEWRKRGSFHVIIGPLFHIGLLGWSHFPWVSLHGLVVIGENELDPRSTTLAHEIGHAVGGLHHVFRGRENVMTGGTSSCNSCIEHAPSDWTGDLCKDTNPTPEFFECRDPTITERPDPCNPARRTWDRTPYNNIMSYAPSECHTTISNDQFERIHCWISQYRNAFHMLTPDEEMRLSRMMVEECYTKEDGSDYRGRFDDFGACKPWPQAWWNVEKGIVAGDNACRNPNPNVNSGLWCFYEENGEKPTLCSLSGTILFLNATCPGSRNRGRYDARYVTALESFRECFTDPMGFDYRGTHTEPFCQNWPRTDPKYGLSTEHRYCRNPVPHPETSNRPWCFTKPNGTEPRYCNLDMSKRRVSCPRIPPDSELKRECYTKENYSDYRGTFNNYGMCDMWPVDDPANGISRSHNYCRNPDNSPSLWCYENSVTRKAIYCDTTEISKFHNPNCAILP